MPWPQMMGAGSVDYYVRMLLEREDDPVAAAAMFGESGEAPLRWGGRGAKRLMLHTNDPVSEVELRRVFSNGGARHPVSNKRLVHSQRPGMELVIHHEKSVTLLAVMGRGDDAVAICEAERRAVMAYLDRVARRDGVRQGSDRHRVPTSGLTYAHTLHGTNRMLDPHLHTHIIVANVVKTEAGWQCLDTRQQWYHLAAAATVGRFAAAREAFAQGYAVEHYNDEQGNPTMWRLVGMPAELEDAFSKRSAQIDAAQQSFEIDHPDQGANRRILAWETRGEKRYEPLGELTAAWRAEMIANGYDPATVLATIDTAGREAGSPAARLEDGRWDEVVAAIVERSERATGATPKTEAKAIQQAGRVAPYGVRVSELLAVAAACWDGPLALAATVAAIASKHRPKAYWAPTADDVRTR